MSQLSYPKRLIEVDLPIKRISEHARREKSIRHGHISTLHIWWARRPLAACRAVTCAALWPDPADENCPQAFREAATSLLAQFAEKVRSDKALANLCTPASFRRWNRTNEAILKAENPACWPDMRYALLDFIADFANWDASTVPAYLETARALTQAAHEALGGAPGTRPLVVDPFAGGGAIPLEALRVGADAFASDLNPVAVLLNKVVLEYIPKYGQRLADEVSKWGDWVKKEAEKELAEFYPREDNGTVSIAYLWMRTITCEAPSCGAQIPLTRSLWLAKKGDASVALRIIPSQQDKQLKFEIIENVKSKDVGEGTVRGGSATCPICGYTTPVKNVRAQFRDRRGGSHDARLVAVRYDDAQSGERTWRLANQQDLNAFGKAAIELERRVKEYSGPLSLVPDEPLPPDGTLGFRIQKYGMLKWGDLFSPRQALALVTLGRIVREAPLDCDSDLKTAVRTSLALAVDRLADFNASLCVLNSVGGRGVVHVFGRQALPIVWDFMETNPFNTEAANWQTCIDVVGKTIQTESLQDHEGIVQTASATMHPLADDTAKALITDPPYYDAVPYADLSDFFYVWLRRNLGVELPELARAKLTPKVDECIVNPVARKDKSFYERTMAQAMNEGRRILQPDGIGIVVFAHKSTSGWESQLQAMIDAGWTITGSWPIDTERPGRLRAQDSAALASSVHLVCRPRENPDGSVRTDDIGDWRDVLQELPRRIHEWMPRLAAEGVVGADAIFACLGPALEIFSRYSRVEKASGEEVRLKEYLEYVWAAVSKEALNMIFQGGDATGFEADARLTAMWLWTLSTNPNGSTAVPSPDEEETEAEDDEEGVGNGKATGSGYSLEYDAARKIAQGLGAHLEKLGTLVEVKGSNARLLPVSERARFLFGKDDEDMIRPSARKKTGPVQLNMFDLAEIEEVIQSSVNDKPGFMVGKTSLDHVHQAMLLFGAGRSDALKRFLVESGVGRDQKFRRLAQALSALYPAGSDEKRWVDGVQARLKGLGF